MTIDSADPGGVGPATGPDAAPTPTHPGPGARVSRRTVLSLGAGAIGGLAVGRATAWLPLSFVWPFGSGATFDDDGAPRTGLPPIPANAELDAGPSTARTIAMRRSIRAFDPSRSITPDELSRLLFLTAGITDPRGLRAQPSAGALYPIELYAMVLRVDDIAPGIYRYDPGAHQLVLRRAGDVRSAFGASVVFQGFPADGVVALVMTSITERLVARYGDRSERYALLEAGHMSQNAHLAATAMGLGVVGIGAYNDGALGQLLGVSAEHEAPVFLVAVGHPPPA